MVHSGLLLKDQSTHNGVKWMYLSTNSRQPIVNIWQLVINANCVDRYVKCYESLVDTHNAVQPWKSGIYLFSYEIISTGLIDVDNTKR